MTTQSTALRRYSLLCSLAFMPGSSASVRDLQREMARVHSQSVSRDLVRGDLSWLSEQGLVKWRCSDLAQVTERGQDVATRDAPWPGGPIQDHQGER
jgi:hypothetical protein